MSTYAFFSLLFLAMASYRQFRSFLFFLLFLFCFYFLINKCYLLKLMVSSFCCQMTYFSINTNLFTDEKHTQWNLDTTVKVFHESILCSTESPWNCICILHVSGYIKGNKYVQQKFSWNYMLFYKQNVFSPTSRCCLTFSWIELQILLRYCLIHKPSF